jgi:hypothetical protein
MSLSADTVSFASEVIQPPSVPYRPIGLSPLIVLALSAIVGFMVGLVILFYLPESVLGPYDFKGWKTYFLSVPDDRASLVKKVERVEQSL